MKIKITDEYYNLVDENCELDRTHFNTGNPKNDIDIFIPISGYYKVRVNCTNQQLAMTEVLRIGRLNNFNSISDATQVIDIIDEGEAYYILPDDLLVGK